MRMIEVERWSVRMDSGEVHVIDPIETREIADTPDRIMSIIRAADPIFEDVPGGYVVVEKYDRLESVHATTPVVIFLRHVSSVTVVYVQQDADE